jgi:hypothetical protein
MEILVVACGALAFQMIRIESAIFDPRRDPIDITTATAITPSKNDIGLAA